jgi:hypothetical protein
MTDGRRNVVLESHHRIERSLQFLNSSLEFGSKSNLGVEKLMKWSEMSNHRGGDLKASVSMLRQE